MRGLGRALYVSVYLCSRNSNNVMESSCHGNSMTKAWCVFIVGCRLTWKYNSMVLSIFSTENFMIILPDFIHRSWVSLTNSMFCWKDVSHLHPFSMAPSFTEACGPNLVHRWVTDAVVPESGRGRGCTESTGNSKETSWVGLEK